MFVYKGSVISRLNILYVSVVDGYQSWYGCCQCPAVFRPDVFAVFVSAVDEQLSRAQFKRSSSPANLRDHCPHRLYEESCFLLFVSRLPLLVLDRC